MNGHLYTHFSVIKKTRERNDDRKRSDQFFQPPYLRGIYNTHTQLLQNTHTFKCTYDIHQNRPYARL